MKKMRRLIPAIAMLLVSAVMLSTASFAWFTMNEQVTASGMQIQAQATGSLIIDDQALNFQSSDTSVDLYTKNEKLMPITYASTAVSVPSANGGTDQVTGWVKPSKDAKINPSTGKFETAAWEKVTTTSYYVEKSLWIGSAGEKLENQSITIDLTALVAPDTLAAYAYAAAIYVVEQNADLSWTSVTHDATPTHVIYVDSKNGRNTVTLTNTVDGVAQGYTIPSILGVGAQGDGKTCGLKIVVRFFVDGALEALANEAVDGVYPVATKHVVTGYGYDKVDKTDDETPFDAANAYFKKNVGDNPATEAVETDYTWYTPISTEGMTEYPSYDVYTQTFVYGDVPYNYVNSDEVPSNGTSMEIKISAAPLN